MAKTRKRRNLIGLLETSEHECRRIKEYYFLKSLILFSCCCGISEVSGKIQRRKKNRNGINEEEKSYKYLLVGSLKVFLASSWVSLHRFLARSPASGAH